MEKIYKISADRIYDGKGEVFDNHFIMVNQDGEIKAVEAMTKAEDSSLKKYSGILVPGFINTHCHLELSHMKGLVPTGTGLVEFIKEVVTKRESPQEIIQEAIYKSDQEMYENGIVAVGDISNVSDTFECKSSSLLKYITFVEMFDFRQEDNAHQVFDQYLKVYNELKRHGLEGTVVPHAPYSVSKNLFRLINQFNKDKDCTISIHNMETQGENDMFLYNSGEMISFFEKFGIPTHSFESNSKTAIHYAMQQMDSQKRTILVHNTLCNKDDIASVQEWNSEAYWTSCASANLYIENRLPKYKNFIELGAKMALGTDSLTSNWGLSILEEMKIIHRFQSFISFDQLIQWACYNGACALGLEKELGSIEIGKRPGINLLTSFGNHEPESLSQEVRVQKII